jgi:hypothetical protein
LNEISALYHEKFSEIHTQNKQVVPVRHLTIVPTGKVVYSFGCAKKKIAQGKLVVDANFVLGSALIS